MGGLESDTIGGFNGFIEKQCKLEGETVVTAVLFDDRYEILWNGLDAQKTRLTEKDYFVRGSTALLDAVGKTILEVGYRISRTTEKQRPGKVIFVITTDGLENASREFTYEKVKSLIKHQQEVNHWEFIFLGANIDATTEAGNLGIGWMDAYNFEASEAGVEGMYEAVYKAVSEKRSKN